MPISKCIEATDDLFVTLNEPHKNQTFAITLVNTGTRNVRCKKISIDLPFIKVVNYDQDNAVIKIGDEKQFLFETEYVLEQSDAKIRFSFSNSTQLTRSVRIVPNDFEKMIKLTDLAPNDEWIDGFLRKYPQALDITDDINVEFEPNQSSASFEISIRNNTRKAMTLGSIDVDLVTVKCQNQNAITINPNQEVKLNFTVDYVPERFKDKARIHFFFGRRLSMNRTVAITYRQKRLNMQRSLYDVPLDLENLMHSERKISRSQLLDSLDNVVCKDFTPPEYGPHFHGLLHLEDICLSKEVKDLYNQNKVYFCDRDCKTRKRYEQGVYDMNVNELFETRPSLQLGDKLIARKRSQVDVPFEGVIIDIKHDDLIVVQFDNEFVKQFNHTGYMVEFICSRINFIRMHYAIDLALETFGIDFLMPTVLSPRQTPNMDVHLDKNNNMVLKKRTKLKWFNDKLNVYQRQAVANVLRADFLNPYIIHGPPGTGKTTTLSEIVLQIAKHIKDSKILITTSSNSAANLITERLLESKKVDSKSLLRLIAFKYRNKNSTPVALKAVCKTFEDLLPDQDFNLVECLKEVRSYRIVVGTYSSIGKLIEVTALENIFTHAVVDEAGQCTEMGVLIPMVLVGKTGQTIMAGDPMQMPPFVVCGHASDRGLAVSMISRLLDCYSNLQNVSVDESPLVSHLLYNYRALPSILNYYNKQFYDSKLIATIKAEGSREAQLLKHFCEIFASLNSEHSQNYGIHFFNVDGLNKKRKNSWFNVEEVQVVKVLTEKMCQIGLSPRDIGIITPYAMQVRAIQHSLQTMDEIRIGSVEDFQGLERKIVLISTVRTCSGGVIVDAARRLGFVKCPKRINVAMSRARVMIIVVGKQELLSTDEHWNAVIEGCKVNKTYIDVTSK